MRSHLRANGSHGPTEAPLRSLIAHGLGSMPLRSAARGTPLVIFVRVPNWLGNRARHPENCEAPLDLGCCAALAEQLGYRAAILDLETGAYDVERVIESLRAAQPRVIFVSAITPAVAQLLHIAGGVKSGSETPLTVACGHHADAVPETFLFARSPVDICIRGELEATSEALLIALSRNASLDVPGTLRWSAKGLRDNGERPLITDLDGLPRPTHEYFLNHRYRHLHPMQALGPFRWGFIQGARGCPFPCVYCSKSLRTSFGTPFRVRSPQSIVEEMRFLARRGVNVLVFTDDVFNTSRGRVLELCDAIKTSGVEIAWKAQGRAEPTDLGMFRAMRSAGCSTFSIGVESGSPRIIESLRKKSTLDGVERAFRNARQAGLYRVGFFMVGCPGERESDFMQTAAILRRLDPDMIQVAFFTCYPGSQAYAQHCSSRDSRWSEFQHYEAYLNLSGESVDVVRGWQKRLYRQFLLRPGFLLRYLRRKHVNLLLNFRDERFLVEQAVRSVFFK